MYHPAACAVPGRISADLRAAPRGLRIARPYVRLERLLFPASRDGFIPAARAGEGGGGGRDRPRRRHGAGARRRAAKGRGIPPPSPDWRRPIGSSAGDVVSLSKLDLEAVLSEPNRNAPPAHPGGRGEDDDGFGSTRRAARQRRRDEGTASEEARTCSSSGTGAEQVSHTKGPRARRKYRVAQGVQRLSAREVAPLLQGVRWVLNMRARSSAPYRQGGELTASTIVSAPGRCGRGLYPRASSATLIGAARQVESASNVVSAHWQGCGSTGEHGLLRPVQRWPNPRVPSCTPKECKESGGGSQIRRTPSPASHVECVEFEYASTKPTASGRR